MKKLFLLLLVGLNTAAKINSQNLNFPGLAPSVSFTVHQKNFDLNFLVASKTKEGYHTVKNVEYAPRFLEIYSQALVARKLKKRWILAAGYGFQRNNPFRSDWRNEHRLVQQAMYSVPGNKIRFNNRLRFEERWFSYPDAPGNFSTRARYQAGIVRQLNKNIYWQLNNEVYAITSGRRHSFISENWLYSGIGFPVKGLGHFETGIGYNSVVRNERKEWISLILLQVNWSFVLPSKMKTEMHPVMHGRNF
jgi:hypothetical protein